MAVAAATIFAATGAFVGMRSARAAGVSVREVQPFKALQHAQPVKAFVDWLEPIVAKGGIATAATGFVTLGSMAPPIPPQANPNPTGK